MSAFGSEHLRWELVDGAGWLTIDRPAVKNAMSIGMARELRGRAGFQWDTWDQAAAYALEHRLRLEDALGAHLLNRTTRKLTLTAEGEVFLERCRRILSGDTNVRVFAPPGSSSGWTQPYGECRSCASKNRTARNGTGR